MTAAELREVDPQQKILLEIVHECLESSGTTNWRGKEIGVYAGAFGGVRAPKEPSGY